MDNEFSAAQFILRQLGGSRFIAKTGAKIFAYNGNTLGMTLPKNASKANRLYITVNYPSLKALGFLLLRRILAQYTLRYLCSGISLHKTLRSPFQRDVFIVLYYSTHYHTKAKAFGVSRALTLRLHGFHKLFRLPGTQGIYNTFRLSILHHALLLLLLLLYLRQILFCPSQILQTL